MIAQAMYCTTEDVIRIVQEDLSPAPAAAPKGAEGLLREEWEAFLSASPSEDTRSPFIAENVDLGGVIGDVGDGHPFRTLGGYIDAVVLAKRIREVRALQGFERQEPGATIIRPDLDRNLDWLPGIEVFGEGVFLSLQEEALLSWEAKNRKAIGKRLDAMQAARRKTTLSFLPEFSARFVVLHTLAHMLIRQLSFECGYASSSLRERIFAADPGSGRTGMAGILIYTAEGDAEGSLGGLVREGQPERFFPTLLTALQNARWCSSDPICRELAGSGAPGAESRRVPLLCPC